MIFAITDCDQDEVNYCRCCRSCISEFNIDIVTKNVVMLYMFKNALNNLGKCNFISLFWQFYS